MYVANGLPDDQELRAFALAELTKLLRGAGLAPAVKATGAPPGDNRRILITRNGTLVCTDRAAMPPVNYDL